MSVEVTATKSARGDEGWRIRAVVYVPEPELFDGKKQLVRDRFVLRTECLSKQLAKDLGNQWEKELYDKIHNKGTEVKLKDCMDVLIAQSKNTAEVRKAKFVSREIGDLSVDIGLRQELTDWGNNQRTRKIKTGKNLLGEDGALVIGSDCKPKKKEKKIAESTVRGYLRLPKTAINKFMEKYPGRLINNPLARMKIGRNLARKRPIKPDEMRVLDETTKDYNPDLVFPMEFAKANMIRPQDQFNLDQEQALSRDSDGTWALEYTPLKTEEQVLEPVFAHPVVFDNLKPYFDSLHPPEVCSSIFTRHGLRRLGEDPAKLYPITQSFMKTSWKAIIKIASKKLPSVADIFWYDLRHHAVGFLLRNGFNSAEIMDIAGWTTPDMIWRYYPRGGNLHKGAILKMRESQAKKDTFVGRRAA